MAKLSRNCRASCTGVVPSATCAGPAVKVLAAALGGPGKKITVAAPVAAPDWAWITWAPAWVLVT